jgi:hypothetical protein
VLGDDFEVVLYCHEIAMRELRAHRRNLARLVLVHKYAYVPGQCSAGEECAGLWLLWGGKQYQIPLSVTHLLPLDYLCHQRLGKSAAEIVDGLAGRFYVHHGSNAPGHIVKPARSSRVAVRKQLQRIREVMADFFAANGIDLDPWAIIRSEPTSTREVKYRVDAVVTWDHPEWRGVTE